MGEESEPGSSQCTRLLLLLKQLMLLLMQESWCRRRCPVGGKIATGGISMDLSWGGGCCHWGRGPARRRFWRSGPASITACSSFPFSGNTNGFSAPNFEAACGCGDNGCGIVIRSEFGDAVMVSSESEEAKCLLFESLPFDSISSFCAATTSWSCCCCCFCSSCWSMSLSKTSLRHFAWASSLSWTVLLRRSLSWTSSSSLFAIFSFAEKIVVSSSKVVHRRECFNSCIPCSQIKKIN